MPAVSTPRRPLALVAAIALALAACSSDDASSSDSAPPSSSPAAETTTVEPDATAASDAPAGTDSSPATDQPTTSAPPAASTEQPTTTAPDPASLATAYVAAGPYPVGVTKVAIENGINVEVWYPAVAGSSGTDTYDVRDYTAPAIQAILTADVPATYTSAATRDAAVADGAFPVVLNSHGFSGIRVGSTFLTAHLASWGVIVVSPDHPTRDLYHSVAQITPDVVTTPVDDLLASLDMIVARSTTAGDLFEGHVDPERVGALGHSAGGGTILAAAADQRIDGYVSMASGLLGDTDPATLPAKPSFFLAGALDQVISTERTRAAFLAVPSPSLYWSIGGVGHNGFDDFCTFGDGKGIIGIAEASGLGGLLDTMPEFRSLGEDGCVPPAVPVETTFPIIQHAVTAWFMQLFGVDTAPRGLGPEVSASYVEPVTIEVR